MREKSYYVYITASRKHGTLYIGVTSDLAGRIWQHRHKVNGGFTARYDVDKLVWYEVFDNAPAAIAKEKKLKKFYRDWKIALIEDSNPNWVDLYPALSPEIR